ncbi:MAG: 30S ribosomal protein S12 methylthiotransferase RimO [Victivallales bacterium]|nr:30S ribosomal protein S12 methylthiotransferase RimO [Victivallales bacterium]MCF7889015.1 30S ribosomal protein S12 methylthiotransferase RimO [Victivallales bacterium]
MLGTERPVYVYIISLGCSKNFVDTEILAASLVTNNLGITDNIDEADICIVNTCAFIPPARVEAEENIEFCIDWKNLQPFNRKLIICGCLTQWDGAAGYFQKYPEVDLWLGIDETHKITEYIGSFFKITSDNKTLFNSAPSFLYSHNTPRLQLTPPHYAYIKIADGCNNRCSYCSIPNIRGRLRSRNIASIRKEMKGLLANGVKEVLIIAQDITAFAADVKNSENLSALLKEIDSIDGDYWIRLHYLHPEGITDELINTIASAKHIIPYLDIPIQHASDKILSKMNRKITCRELNEILGKLRKNIDKLILRSTFLVGFPGETAEDFTILKEFIEKWKFERFGVFPYYPEPNTAAAGLQNKVSDRTADERVRILQELYEIQSQLFNENLKGKSFKAIIDNEEDNYFSGRTYMDSPEIDNKVKIKKRKLFGPGDFCEVKIEKSSAFELKGRIIL